MSERHKQSPESTNDYRCLSCDNRTYFIGYDDRGYPGAACSCGAWERDEERYEDAECTCRVTLKQLFKIEDGEPHYDIYVGGGADAEIGSYTRIRCAQCLELIYVEPGFDDAGKEVSDV